MINSVDPSDPDTFEADLDPPKIDIEVPEADAAEQARAVELGEDEYR